MEKVIHRFGHTPFYEQGTSNIPVEESALFMAPGVAALLNLAFPSYSPPLVLALSFVAAVPLSKISGNFTEHLITSRSMAGFGIGYWMAKAMGQGMQLAVLYGFGGALLFHLNALSSLDNAFLGALKVNKLDINSSKPCI